MWLFTPFGFYSIVQKPGDTHLTVRARVTGDLDNLRTLVPELSKTVAGAGTDYPYRATVSKPDFMAGMSRVIQAVTYDNFKNEVARVQGVERTAVYEKVWWFMRWLRG